MNGTRLGTKASGALENRGGFLQRRKSIGPSGRERGELRVRR